MSDWLSLWNPTVESCPLYHPKERRSVYYWSNMSQGTIALYSMIDISMFSKYEQTLHLTLTSYWIAHLHRSYWISHVLRFLHLQRTHTTLHRVFYQSQQTGHQPPVFTNNPVRGQGKLFPVSTRKFGLESWVRLSRLTSARSIFVPGLNITLTHGNPHPPSCFPLWFPLEPSCTIGLMSIAFTAEKSPAQGH